nr:MAG TPA: hypothetical protein [Caudoviricetes sp.]
MRITRKATTHLYFKSFNTNCKERKPHTWK